MTLDQRGTGVMTDTATAGAGDVRFDSAPRYGSVPVARIYFAVASAIVG